MKKAVCYIWDKFEELLIFALFLVIMLTVTLQIINREFIGAVIIWTEELARYLYVWVAYVGFAYVVKNRRALRIDVLADRLGRAGKLIFSAVEHLVTMALAAWLFVIFSDYIAFTSATVAPALRIPIRFVYIIFPVSMAMLFVRAAVCLAQDVLSLRRGGKSKEAA